MIDELSKELTTQQVIAHYRKQFGRKYLDELAKDMANSSKGNQLAIEACLGNEWNMYMRDVVERPINEDEDIIKEMLSGG